MTPPPFPSSTTLGDWPAEERLLQLLLQMKGVRLFVLGDILVDRYMTGRTSRISREAPVLILKRTGESIIPGQAANTAANAAAMGAHVTLWGFVGKDKIGQDLAENLTARGVDLRVGAVPGGRTLSKLRVLAGGQHTTVQQVIRIDDDDGLVIPNEIQSQLVEDLEQSLPQAQAVAACDYGYGCIPPQTWTALRERCNRSKIPIILDSRYRFTQYHGADQITPNEEEAMAAAGLAAESPYPGHETVGRALFKQTRARSILLTRGNEGMVLFEGPEHSGVPIPVFGSKDCRDVTGAGDTVAAMNSLALACGATPLEAAVLANIAGAQVVQKVGTATTTAQEMGQAIKSDYKNWIRDLDKSSK